jgi:hypothetical protein
VLVLPSSPAAAPSRRWSTGNLQFQQQQEQQQRQQQRKERSNFLTGLGRHVGRHVKWLGSTAATATGTIAVLASRQVGYLVNGARSNPGAAAAAAMFNGNGSNGFFRQQQQQQPGGALSQRTVMGQRSRSAPSLAVVAAGGSAAAVAAAGAAAAVPQAGLPGPTTAVPAAAGVIAPGDVLDDAIFTGGCSGSSSVTCSSINGRPSGVGRQVLNLPAPRISWGRRASHAVIVGQ